MALPGQKRAHYSTSKSLMPRAVELKGKVLLWMCFAMLVLSAVGIGLLVESLRSAP